MSTKKPAFVFLLIIGWAIILLAWVSHGGTAVGWQWWVLTLGVIVTQIATRGIMERS